MRDVFNPVTQPLFDRIDAVQATLLDELDAVKAAHMADLDMVRGRVQEETRRTEKRTFAELVSWVLVTACLTCAATIAVVALLPSIH